MQKFSVNWLIYLGLISAAGAQAAPLSASQYPLKPKLVVVFVIDQFRADYLTRFKPQFLPARGPQGKLGGFNFLLERGAYYPYAQYDLLQCMTGPGHATISTGSYPYQSGIPLNYWFDSVKRKPVYCTEDAAALIVPAELRHLSPKGASPRNLVTTTLGDELKNAGHPSQVVSIALKDRAAILMGGHRADLALWFDPAAQQWVSSTFYLPDNKPLPNWVGDFNARWAKKKGQALTWNAPPSPSALTAGGAAPYRTKTSESIGAEFPHRSSIGEKSATTLPFGLDITADLATQAVKSLKLGQGPATDILWVSFSSHDYMGHAFGPNSHEMEAMTLHEDRMLAEFFGNLKTTLKSNFEETWFVLSADHGAPSAPEWLTERRVPASRFDEEKARRQLNDALNVQLGKPGTDREWVAYTRDFNFFFDLPLMAEKKIDRAAAELAAQAVLEKIPGVARVITRSQARESGRLPGQFGRTAGQSYYEGRTGDLIIVPQPNTITLDDTVEHLTGYTYDRTVPLILVGKPFRPGVYAERAEVVDIAPTLAWLLGIIPPAASEGRVLHEALQDNLTTQVKSSPPRSTQLKKPTP